MSVTIVIAKDIEVTCVCDAVLSASIDRYGDIAVYPCPSCLEKKNKKGYEEGKKKGESE